MSMRGVDQEGIAEEIQAGPPVAMCSSDRQYLRSYYAATKDGEIEAPICFFCACVYARAEQCKSNDISWQQPTKNDEWFLFMHCGRDARVICIGDIHGKIRQRSFLSFVRSWILRQGST